MNPIADICILVRETYVSAKSIHVKTSVHKYLWTNVYLHMKEYSRNANVISAEHPGLMCWRERSLPMTHLFIRIKEVRKGLIDAPFPDSSSPDFESHSKAKLRTICLNKVLTFCFCILSEWVGLKELSGLDIACWHFADHLLVGGICVGGESFNPQNPNRLHSLGSKSTYSAEVFDVNGTMLDFMEYAGKLGKHVKQITVKNDSASIADALQLCSNFTRLWKPSRTVHPWGNYGFQCRSDYNPDCAELGASLQLDTLLITDGMSSTEKLLGMTSPTALRSLRVELSTHFTGADLHNYLSKGCYLKALCLSGTLADGEVISLLELCPNLNHFDAICFRLTRECLPALAVQLSSLHLQILRIVLMTQLSVHGCTVFVDGCSGACHALSYIAGYCTGFTQLRIYWEQFKSTRFLKRSCCN